MAFRNYTSMLGFGGRERIKRAGWAGFGLVMCSTACSCAKAPSPPPEATTIETAKSSTAELQPAKAVARVTSQPPSERVEVKTAENSPAAAKQTDFNAYWRELRPALLSASAESVALLTKFPFTVRGELDDDPVRAIERPAFPAILRQLLAQDVGLSPEPEPLSRYLKRMGAVPTSAISGTTARVASMQFAVHPEGWRFVGAYLAESE